MKNDKNVEENCTGQLLGKERKRRNGGYRRKDGDRMEDWHMASGVERRAGLSMVADRAGGMAVKISRGLRV